MQAWIEERHFVSNGHDPQWVEENLCCATVRGWSRDWPGKAAYNDKCYTSSGCLFSGHMNGWLLGAHFEKVVSWDQRSRSRFRASISVALCFAESCLPPVCLLFASSYSLLQIVEKCNNSPTMSHQREPRYREWS